MSNMESDLRPVQAASLFRQRDILLLAFVVLATYLSLDSAGLLYTLTPCWYLHDPPSALKRSLSPIITDLDGDGVNEVVLITKDLKLKVLNAEAPNGDYSDVYSPEVVHSAGLSSSTLNIKKGQAPVAMKTGYVNAYSDTTQRSQVIVVLREDWTVACFDSKLNLLWEKAVAHKTHSVAALRDMYHISDASITIAPLHFSHLATGTGTGTGAGDGDAKAEDTAGKYLGGTGCVVIGASMSLREGEGEGEGEGATTHVHVHAGMDPALDGKDEHADLEERSALEHFNIYVLSAATGQILWAHDGEHRHANHDEASMRQALPQQQFSLEKRDLGRKATHGPGVRDWSVFKQSLLGELPHRWGGLADASMHLAHFERRHMAGRGAASQAGGSSSSSSGKSGSGGSGDKAAASQGGAPSAGAAAAAASKKKRGGGKGKGVGEGKQDPSSELFRGIELAPLSQSASLPHDAAEHTEYPNVVVAHTRGGIEIVALRTGDAVTALSLPSDRSYADLDGDGVVDQLIVLDSKDHARAHEDMFGEAHAILGLGSGQANHCTLVVMSGLPARHQLFNGTVCKRGHSLQDPLNLKNRRVNMYGGSSEVPLRISSAAPLVMRAARPRSHRESPVRDVVVAINAGVVTSYSGKGDFKWQVSGAPTWAEDFLHHSLSSFDADAGRADETGKHDNIHSDILISGDSSISLLSRDGFVLAQVSVPRTPVARPTVGDFDSDGVTDIIVLTEEAVLGYRLEAVASTRGVLVATVVLSAVAFVAFASKIKLTTTRSGKDGRAQRTFTSSRATDQYHVD